MKLSRISPLYENVFQLMDLSTRAAAAKQAGKESGQLSYDDAVKYMAILTGFMLADRGTRDNEDLLKRSYAPIGALYRASPEDTKAALDQFWKALQRRPLEFGSKDVKTVIQKYFTFLKNGEAEQWENVVGQLRKYFTDRQASVKDDPEKQEHAA